MRCPARPLIHQWTVQGFGFQPVPIQQDKVMNVKTVLLPSTYQSLIMTAPTGVSMALSEMSVHAIIAIVHSVQS